MEAASTSHDHGAFGEFLFLGNHLALDFVNTRPFIDGQFVELLPDFTALLRWFQATSLLDSKEAARLQKSYAHSPLAPRTERGVREFREKLRSALESWEQGSPVPREIVEQLNRLMISQPMLHRLQVSRNDASLIQWFNPQRPDDLFAPLAYHVAKLFSQKDSTRVRQCGACVLHFLDTSKKGTRRWCSMEICGNRAKVAAYAARQRHGRV